MFVCDSAFKCEHVQVSLCVRTRACVCECVLMCDCKTVFVHRRQFCSTLGNTLLSFQLLSFYFLSLFLACSAQALLRYNGSFPPSSQQQWGDQQQQQTQKQPLSFAINVWSKNQKDTPTKTPTESQMSTWATVTGWISWICIATEVPVFPINYQDYVVAASLICPATVS